MRYNKKLAGIVALSSYLPLAATLEGERSKDNKGASILMAHGSADPVIPVDLANASRDVLKALVAILSRIAREDRGFIGRLDAPKLFWTCKVLISITTVTSLQLFASGVRPHADAGTWTKDQQRVNHGGGPNRPPPVTSG